MNRSSFGNWVFVNLIKFRLGKPLIKYGWYPSKKNTMWKQIRIILRGDKGRDRNDLTVNYECQRWMAIIKCQAEAGTDSTQCLRRSIVLWTEFRFRSLDSIIVKELVSVALSNPLSCFITTILGNKYTFLLIIIQSTGKRMVWWLILSTWSYLESPR